MHRLIDISTQDSLAFSHEEINYQIRSFIMVRQPVFVLNIMEKGARVRNQISIMEPWTDQDGICHM